MPSSKSRFITACQQVLALGVVLAVLTPAASVVSLDVVREAPAGAGVAAGGQGAALASYSRVPTAPVDAVVREVPLTAPANARIVPGGLQARAVPGSEPGTTELVSAPQALAGYGTVGVTWAHGEQVADDAVSFAVRTRTAGAWSSWQPMDYHDEHGPDPDSAEALRARPGTDEALVGDVDAVQVRTTTSVALPDDMRLAVIEPGTPQATAQEAPADVAPAEPAARAGARTDAGVPQPSIFTRAQWGANEALRDKGSLRYGSINGGFVHHTVNANDYSRDEVPGILRSIYAYHTQSRGWSDIGYNFLVDRFGQIWEGRYGGIDKPVVGAHTLGYNDYSFAMSAIGNFEVAKPSEAMVSSYGALFAWKLSLAGVDASSMRQKIGSSTFAAINGHRDAGSTACPGRYLYARIGDIRRIATSLQQQRPTWTGRQQSSDLVAGGWPDLIARRASDGVGVIIPTGGLTRFGGGRAKVKGFGRAARVVLTPDVTGDSRADVLVLDRSGVARVRPGNGRGDFRSSAKALRVFRGHDLVTAVGDLDGNGHQDFVGRARGGRLDLFSGGGKGGFVRARIASGFNKYDRLVGPGDLTGDGRADLLARDTTGRLWLYRGTGRADLANRTAMTGSWQAYDAITGRGDLTGDGLTDLVVRRAGNGRAFVLPGRGDGTFAPRVGPYGQLGGAGPVIGAAALDGSGPADLVTRRGRGQVTFLNAGTVNLTPPVVTSVNLRNARVVLNAGDWDKDGFGDILTVAASNGRLFLRRGDGRGGFGPAVAIGEGFSSVSQLMVVGDLNRDGWPDLLGQPATGAMRVYPGQGAAPVLASQPATTTGSLAAARSLGLDLTRFDWVVEVSDLDQDGTPDLVVRERGTGRLYAVRRTGSGLAAPWFLGEGMNAYDLVG